MSSLLRLPAVIEKTGLSKTEIYRRIQKGTFPKHRKMSERISVWVSDEVETWVRQWVTNADLKDILG